MIGAARGEAPMESALLYQRQALECLEIAEGLRDPVAREQMLQLAQFWARMVERHSPPTTDDRGLWAA